MQTEATHLSLLPIQFVIEPKAFSPASFLKRVCQKPEFINFTFATAAVNGVKLSKMDF
jgi:hypothetical protein